MRWIRRICAIAAVGVMVPLAASAQTIGTFRWQTQPFCNVITVAISIAGPAFRLEGTDDHCGAATKASVIGMAFPNADGSIGLGLTIVSPGAAVLHVDATVLLNAGFNGTWRDTVGRSGTWLFTPGAGLGGPARPIVAPLSYGSVLTQPGGAEDRGLSAIVASDTGPVIGDAAAIYGQLGAGSGFNVPGSAGTRGDSAEGIGVLGTSNSGVGVAGGAATDGIAVQGYAEGANSVGVVAAHAAGGTALEVNGSIKVAGAVRAAFVHTVPSVGVCTVVDHPLLNGDPNALVFVSNRNTTSPFTSIFRPLSQRWEVCGTISNMVVGTEVSVLVIKQ